MSTYPILMEILHNWPLVILAAAVMVVFKPLLLGVCKASVLVVKPKLTKEERLQRRQMQDAMALKRMLNSLDGSPSHVAELQALASRV